MRFVPPSSAAARVDGVMRRPPARVTARLSGEDRLIARYFRPLAKAPGALGLVDDAALYTPRIGEEIVVTADALVAGVHFFPDDPADAIARKALRVNLSDLAAKGAKPAGFLLSLVLPDRTDESWLRAFARGLRVDSRAYACPLLGGDTVRTPGPLTLSIAALGTVPRGKMVKRSGARAGDRLFVTGTIGDAALGLLVRCGDKRLADLPKRWREALQRRYRVPEPRNEIAPALRAHASAAMDVSDGLAGDLGKLCHASGVTADIQVARVPLSLAAKAALSSAPDLLATILSGGDDYEVLAAVPPRNVGAFVAAAAKVRVRVAEIGVVVAGKRPPRIPGQDGRPLTLARLSFSHF